MSNVKFNVSTIKYISLFENVTRTKARDCIEDEGILIFLVEPHEIGRAIGKNGANIKRLESLTKKKIKIAEYSDDLIRYIRSMLMPLKADSIEESDGIVTIKSDDTKTKGLMIGRNAQNLRKLEKYVQRYFDNVKEIKVM
jgi:N utilization substance protein A